MELFSQLPIQRQVQVVLWLLVPLAVAWRHASTLLPRRDPSLFNDVMRQAEKRDRIRCLIDADVPAARRRSS